MRKPIALYLELFSSFAFLQGLDLSNAWLVDFGTGSGSAAVAGKLIGLNVLALDTNPACLAAVATLLEAPMVENWHVAISEVMGKDDAKRKRELADAVKEAIASTVRTLEFSAGAEGTPAAPSNNNRAADSSATLPPSATQSARADAPAQQNQNNE